LSAAGRYFEVILKTKNMGLYKRTKNNKKPLIRQIIDLVPRLPVADRSPSG